MDCSIHSALGARMHGNINLNIVNLIQTSEVRKSECTGEGTRRAIERPPDGLHENQFNQFKFTTGRMEWPKPTLTFKVPNPRTKQIRGLGQQLRREGSNRNYKSEPLRSWKALGSGLQIR